MKKFTLIVAMFIVTAFTATFANVKGNVNEKITNAFNKEFSGALEIKWDNSKTFAKATFKLNGQVMFAYYSLDGDLLGVTRNIVSTQLPLNLQTELKKDYSDCWISDLFEMSNNGSNAYYITLETSTYTIVLKSVENEGWEVYSRTKKAA
ncbi:hypothetical protein HHL16_02980 [Pseudoflavitalea sp. G-6-1-2]|uniref:hypothetical protein n=1 Tax=Pseudoflavitalea sp. G-6-1-2 TaxID=2728841 RepID=UPI00146EC523|nr:hypothetical protein [Pseudoflavitalea sp. G-6-1-2]NML19817.1 hypothetical protein [Pseudoflavitalea sp. G-6-1-2]